MLSVEVLGVDVRGRGVVDAVAEEVADGRGVGVIVVEISGLVRVSGIEGDPLVDVSVPVPDAIPAAANQRLSRSCVECRSTCSETRFRAR